jgi:hypothetical protein
VSGGDWWIHIPYRGRDQSLSDLGFDANSLSDPEERATIIALIGRTQLETRVKTAGELIDSIEGLDRAGRRRLLDDCREAAGLPSASDLDALAEFELAQHVARTRTPSTAPPRLNGVGAIEIIDPDEVAASEREDELRKREEEERRAQR